jgi:hypothetical protein
VQVIHQQVAVGAGGKAIVAGSLNRPDWKHGLAYAQVAPRCPARCRRSKLPCRGDRPYVASPSAASTEEGAHRC